MSTAPEFVTAAARACPVCAGRRARLQFVKDGYDMQGCDDCGTLFVGRDPASIDFDALYGESYYTGGSDAVFADYVGQQAQRRAHARRRLWMLRHLPPRVPRGGRLLDIGCAAGFFLAEARAFYDVQGVELSAWSSAYARDRLGLPVFTGTLQQAALPVDHFDVVTLWDVIEHVADPVPLLTEAARVLRPGGRLILTTGDWGSAYARARGADWHLMEPPWHLTMFSRETMARAGQRAGLRMLHCASEGVAGDGPFWRHRAGLLLARLLDRGDILRMTFTR
ncbi:MAG: class I SAM-dependent methyltransferase [Ideonella sp.]|nr:class I SAM-dependent methyltransferase [Ideonella sp.]MCC7456874.1 class I SAM-dependent methyltransferase [Nitrospira sp.]